MGTAPHGGAWISETGLRRASSGRLDGALLAGSWHPTHPVRSPGWMFVTLRMVCSAW